MIGRLLMDLLTLILLMFQPARSELGLALPQIFQSLQIPEGLELRAGKPCRLAFSDS
ncbi:hypothetical protein SAMN05421636_10823 [Pricia antarctica]|uniref:Uncharacterized protein n=1 Tax=Pricia antarctica TaxID=641691 RepID=A0A1G7G8S8_9FLAO|nr:hypothetical protein SAMN05421636_10823 [Pricia antarctica]